jgi:molybdopterin converting factor small subunit
MQLNVLYMSQLKAAVGRGSESLEVPPGANISDVLAALVVRHGEPFERLARGADGKWQRSLLICVGNRQIPFDDASPLAEGMVVTLLTPISGG